MAHARKFTVTGEGRYFALVNDISLGQFTTQDILSQNPTTSSYFHTYVTAGAADPYLISYASFTVPFKGNFEGNGHTIQNICITSAHPGGFRDLFKDHVLDNTGLFAYLDGATVSNLTLDNVAIYGGKNVGGIAGYAKNSVINNCSVLHGITIASAGCSSSKHIGGLVGAVEGTTCINCNVVDLAVYKSDYIPQLRKIFETAMTVKRGTWDAFSYMSAIRSIFSSGSFIGLAINVGLEIVFQVYNAITSFGDGDMYAGLIGYVDSSDRITLITNCTTTATITSNDYLGGIVGKVDGKANISYCFSISEIEGGKYLGGIVGKQLNPKTIISNCYWTGNITKAKKYVGGIAGINSGTIINSKTKGNINTNEGKGTICGGIAGEAQKTSKIENCSAEIQIKGKNKLGGLVGTLDGTVINCSAAGELYGSQITINDNKCADNYIGGLVGSAGSDSTIRYSTATSNVRGNEYVGGLVGHSKGIITDSSAHGTVVGKKYVGGLAGYLASGDSKKTLIRSQATGDVIGVKEYVGGLVGYAENTIDSCSASGSVQSSNTDGINSVGGLAGRAERSISNSQASGDVTGKQYVGGLVGYASSEHTIDLINCEASGNVKGTAYVGGLAGQTNDNIRNCKASGTVTATSKFVGGLVGNADRTGHAKTIQDCSADGNVTGLENVGGLLGRSYVNVINCHANGTVSGKPEKTAGSYIGGLIGQSASAHSITIEKCYATGDVTDGINYVGGLIGYADDHVSTCYAAGDVSASGQYTGGLIGYAKKTIKMCYATGTVSGNTDVGGLTGHVNSEIVNCYATGSVSGTNKIGGLSGSSNDDITFSAALNEKIKGTNNVGTFSGKFSGSHKTFGSYSWSGMSGSSGDKGTPTDSTRIWNCFPKKMWAAIPGFGQLWTDTWQANSDNEFFKMPVLKSIGYDSASEALHLDSADVHTVIFETEHGSPVPSQIVSTNGKVTRPTPDPVETEFMFTGWYIDSSCTNLWNFDTYTVLTNMTLYAGWKMLPENMHMVVFDVQGHGTMPNTQYVKNGMNATEPTPAPSDEGWIFTGWYTESSCIDKWDFNTEINENMVLYAGWTQPTTLVRFDVQGIGTAPDPQIVVQGRNVSEPTAPEDEKYVFKGWYKESSCTNTWIFEIDTVTEDTTIYAKWEPKMKVTFDEQGYGIEPTPQYVISGEKATNPGDLEDLEQKYVKFAGWYNDPECTEKWDFSTKITNDTTIYAKWTELCQVYFNNRGHGSETETQTVDKGSPAVQPENPVDPNYIFDGWYTSSNYNEAWDFSTPITEPTHIVAKWKPKTYTVTFDTQGGTPTTWTVNCPYGELLDTPENPEKSGYKFAGWHTNVANHWNFATMVVEKDMTLYANWTQATYNITVNAPSTCTVDVSKYNANKYDWITVTVYPDHGYTCTEVTSTPLVNLSTPTLNNMCWSSAFIMPDSDVVLMVTTSPMTLRTVTVNSSINNGTIIADPLSAYEGDEIFLLVIPNDDHAVKNNSVTLQYCSTTENVPLFDGSSYLEGSFVMPAADIIVDAEFIRTEFTVDADANGNGRIFADPLSGRVGDRVNITLVPDTGYNVSSFYVNGVDKKTEIIWSGDKGVYTCTANNDITAKATFSADPRTAYTVMNISDGNGRVIPDITKAYAGDTIHVALVGNPGFIGDTATYTDKDGQELPLTLIPIDDQYVAEFIMPANDTTISGRFKQMPITVTFVLDGTGSVTPTNKTVYYGQSYGTLPTPSRDFNFFRGWYNTGGELINESSIVTIPGEHALIAKWSGPLTITNTKINFGTKFEGYEEHVVEDYIQNEFAETVELNFPSSQWFKFTNSTTQESLNGKTISLEQNDGYSFKVTPKSNLPEGYYTADINMVTSSEVSMGNIAVTMSVLSAALTNDPTVAVPQLPDLYTLLGGYDQTGKLYALGVEGHENLTFTETGTVNISNVTISNAVAAASNRVTIQAMNTYTTKELKDINGFIPLPDSVIIATYPSTNLANGGTYAAALDLKEVSGNLPSLSGAFNDTIASAIQTKEGVTALAMVSAVNDENALAGMNELILDDGVNVSFKIAKSKIPDTSKLVGYHVDKNSIERVYCEVTGSEGDYYTINLIGTGFSTYVLAQSSTPVTPYISSSGRTSGYTQILPEDEAVPTTTPTATSTPTVPTANPTTKPATSQSPAPIAGLIAGLGAVALCLASNRRK